MLSGPETHKSFGRLVLGTAQLGMPYGVANKTGKPDFESALSIVGKAWENGISEFDTAQAYGDSEQILGRIFMELGITKEANVITKLDPRQPYSNEKELYQSVEKTIDRLKVSQLQGLLLHHEKMLDLLDEGFAEMLQGIVKSGHVRHLGISVYAPDKAKQAIGYEFLKIIQLPANILDNRFQQAGIFEIAEQRGRSIYIRSAFLQGLVLMNWEDVPGKMAAVKPVLEKLDHLASKYRLSRHAMALIYLREMYPHARIIFGAEVPDQIIKNIQCWKEAVPEGFIAEIVNGFSGMDERILNPALWLH